MTGVILNFETGMGRKIKQVPKWLLEQVDELVRVAEHTASLVNDFTTVRDFMRGRVANIKLNKRQEELMELYKLVYMEMCNGKLNKSTLASHLVAYKRVGSYRTAVQVIDQALEVYGRLFNIDKQIEFVIMLETNKRMMARAERAGDFKAFAALEKSRLSLLKQIERQEDDSASHFTGYTIDAVYNPRLLGVEPVDVHEVLRIVNNKRGVKIGMEWARGMEIEDAEMITDE